MDRQRLAGIVKRALGRVPTRCRLLYPFYLSAQLTCLEETYYSPALPPAFDGYRIAYASDIHYGPYLNEERARSLQRRLVDLPADLLILGGDYGASTTDGIALFDLLARFSFPDGALGAIGNHDLTGPARQVQALLQRMQGKGVRPLVNDSHVIGRDGQRLTVVSVDDARRGRPDFRQAARGLADGDFVLFMPHSPDVLPALQASMAFAPHLTVCGHTHGGQVTLFGRSLHSSSRYGDRFLTGWKRENGLDILISNGVGTSMMPVRFGAPAQYHLITLRRGVSPSGHPERRLRV